MQGALRGLDSRHGGRGSGSRDRVCAGPRRPACAGALGFGAARGPARTAAAGLAPPRCPRPRPRCPECESTRRCASVPQVKAPLPPSPRPAAPVVDSPPAPVGPGGRPAPGPPAHPQLPLAKRPPGPRRPAAAERSPGSLADVPRGVAAVPGGRGVLGTSFRSRRRLVRALSACVPGLPARQEHLLAMRYGVGAAGAQRRPFRGEDAGLSRGEYMTVRRRALRGSFATPGRRLPARRRTSAVPAIAFGDGGEVRSRGGGVARRRPGARATPR